MTPWIPWDADDEEVENLSVIREPIPESMRAGLVLWLNEQLVSGYSVTDAAVIVALQSALRVTFTRQPGPMRTSALVNNIMAEGDRVVLRVVDFLLSGISWDWQRGMPPAVKTLTWHLDMASSAVEVAIRDDVYRIGKRLPPGVEDAAQKAVDRANPGAQRHLVAALREIQIMDGNTSTAMTESIRAVEAAASPVVIPNDPRPLLAKIVGALRDKPNWSLVLRRRDDDHPDHRAVLIGMLETLAFAQQDRHAGEKPSPEEAIAHVLLAANLVGWFSTGAVLMNE